MDINHITGSGAEELQVLQPLNGGETVFVDPDIGGVTLQRNEKVQQTPSDPLET